MNKKLSQRIDWMITLLPFLLILALCLTFFTAPEASGAALNALRSFLGEEFGWYYLLLGLGIFLLTLYLAFSRFGDIRLGGERPQYSFFQWGSMMFTAGLAADILFYSLCEWMIYAEDPHVQSLGETQDWAGSFPLFHWGPVPWGFYLALSVAFAFMIHVRKRNKQKYSEACRALLKQHTDGILGRLIDLIAVFALIAGTATTFAVSAPLLSGAVSVIFSVSDSTALTISILLFICLVYTVCAYFGIHGISIMAASCTWLFFALLLYVLFLGGMPRYILETGLSSIGNVAQNFISLCTYTDPLRKTGFAQNTTIFYWAYWMVWCVATPFFIGSISRGRTIRELILGGYAAGLLGTWISFIVLGNYGLGLQLLGKVDLLGMYEQSGNLYETILTILRTLPGYRFVLILLVLSMIAFYATSFDSIAVVASAYSYREMSSDEEPDRRLKLFWSVLLILLPIALLFSESSMANLQTVSIIAAFPIGFIMILILASFFRDASDYLKEQEQEKNAKEH